MRRLCAWCGTRIEGSAVDDSLVCETSHGICSACSERFVSQDGVSLQCYIDSIEIPILLVDSNTGILATNTRACELLGKGNRNDIINQLIGPVFDCAHALLPEGCGRTVHCSGCAIRRSVIATFNTGRPQISVPATLSLRDSEQPPDIVFRISTLKIKELVVMRVERVQRTAV